VIDEPLDEPLVCMDCGERKGSYYPMWIDKGDGFGVLCFDCDSALRYDSPLDLGIRRDSSLPAVNHYTLFTEEFEGIYTPGEE